MVLSCIGATRRKKIKKKKEEKACQARTDRREAHHSKSLDDKAHRDSAVRR
jgi:hypothetical protein